ncbi:glycosyltransferase [Corynebacterium sp. TAE3-ERU12]|uniref:glycosyltransferase n=1 Tax=Corynebacterium sp. TAE3-ERU12 TaxID=2849491 RepID=UPI001C495890|nr:glycosyltransferase [Corynebacterium sp. TAE3-ERU12]MBV7295953.1 glycosyltransferase [Corynebacterium sp. TAE3-ERU12]
MTQPTVLHISECYAGGVQSMLERYTALVPEARHVLLANARRADGEYSPDPETFDEILHLPIGHGRAIAEVTKQVRRLQPDVIHAHSSFAGCYARLGAGWLPGVRRKIVYTPHGIALNDPASPALNRFFYRTVETIVSPLTGTFAACSSFEDRTLSTVNPFIRRRIVRNAVLADELCGARWNPSAPPVVGMAGRISIQRNPHLFAAVARSLKQIRPDIQMRWIGDGDAGLRACLEDAGVSVSGWMSHEQVIEEVSKFSVYLHSASHDGFPAAVLEALALGIPTVVPNIAPLFECPAQVRYDDRDQAVSAVLTALDNPDSVIASWAEVRELYSESALRKSLVSLYGVAGAELAA